MDEVFRDKVINYWALKVHDLEMTHSEPGSSQFFNDLEGYHFGKLDYLKKLIPFGDFSGKKVLEVGCGVGFDLARFARGGAFVTGIDVSPKAIELARRHFEMSGLHGDLRVMSGDDISFDDGAFDLVYCHGVINYAPDDKAMVEEIYRVLKPHGKAILMVFNRISWFNFMMMTMKTEPAHYDAPVFKLYSVGEFKNLLSKFTIEKTVIERFPVKTERYEGLKALLFNKIFVGAFNLFPRFLTSSFGWHIICFVRKG